MNDVCCHIRDRVERELIRDSDDVHTAVFEEVFHLMRKKVQRGELTFGTGFESALNEYVRAKVELHRKIKFGRRQTEDCYDDFEMDPFACRSAWRSMQYLKELVNTFRNKKNQELKRL